jgi:hypothetical protein
MPAIDAACLDFVRLRYPVTLRAALFLIPGIWLLRRSRFSPSAQNYFFFGAAFFEAFNGSSVVLPANPRRSRGGALAFEIKT